MTCKSFRLLLVTISVSVLMALAACSPTVTTTLVPTIVREDTTQDIAATAQSTIIATSSQANFDVIAQNMKFNVNTITVKAGATVTVNFTNMDAGVEHNFAVFTTQWECTTAIFVGQNTFGPATVTYTFTAPKTPGTYFFRCDTHIANMNGTFLVVS